LSRIRDAKTRRYLEIDDTWNKGCIFYDEKQAQREYSWLKAHSDVREYILVAQVVKQKPKISCFDDLDDTIPF